MKNNKTENNYYIINKPKYKMTTTQPDNQLQSPTGKLQFMFPNGEYCIDASWHPDNHITPAIEKVFNDLEYCGSDNETNRENGNDSLKQLKKRFGIFTLAIPPAPENLSATHQIHWIFTVDRSGSMSEVDDTGSSSVKYTRLDYIKHTLKNLLMHIVKNIEHSNLLTLQIFDHDCEFIIKNMVITPLDIGLINNIYNTYIAPIETRGSTDIYKAIDCANSHILSVLENPETSNYCPAHIFLTDGDATIGVTNKEQIADLCFSQERNLIPITQTLNIPPPKFSIIGFGTDHNSYLLQKIEDITTYGNYSFVDNYERAGMIYGEIASDIMQEAYYGITITSYTDTKLFNFKTNQWCNQIQIPSLSFEMTKNIHLLCDWEFTNSNNNDTVPHNIIVEMSSPEFKINDNIIPSTQTELQYTDENQSTLVNNEINHNLIKFRFRHSVLCFLYDIKENINQLTTLQNIPLYTLNHDERQANLELINQLVEKSFIIKEDCIETITAIKEWMEETNNKRDLMLNQICEDLYIAIRSLTKNEYGNEYGFNNTFNSHMYINSRLNSQGHQRGYSVSYPQPLPAFNNRNHLYRSIPSISTVFSRSDSIATDRGIDGRSMETNLSSNIGHYNSNETVDIYGYNNIDNGSNEVDNEAGNEAGNEGEELPQPLSLRRGISVYATPSQISTMNEVNNTNN